jgi:hypothetical protein
VALEGNVELKVKLQLDELRKSVAEGSRAIQDLNKIKASIQVDLERGRIQRQLAELQTQLRVLDTQPVTVDVELQKNNVITAIATLRDQLKAVDAIDPKINIDTTSVVKANGLVANLVTGIGQGIGQTIFSQIQQQAFQAAAAIPQVTLQYEKLKTALGTALQGTGQDLETVFGQIKDFAATTPFEVTEVVTAFTTLQNRGIKPTTELLTSLGDIASAQAKPLQQIIEAVLDAGIGQNERLKEFGIQASTSGDKVTLSFKGFNQTVAKTPEAVTNAFIAIGQLQGVAGGMEAQSKTLGGSLSNLQDATESASFAFGNELVPQLTEAVKAISAFIAASEGAAKKTGEGLASAIKFTTDNADALGNSLKFVGNTLLPVTKSAEDFLNVAGKLGNIGGDLSFFSNESLAAADTLSQKVNFLNTETITLLGTNQEITKAVQAQGFATDEQRQKAKDAIKGLNTQLEVNRQTLAVIKESNIEPKIKEQLVKSQERLVDLINKQINQLGTVKDLRKQEVGTLEEINKKYQELNIKQETDGIRSNRAILQSQLDSTKTSFQAQKDAADQTLTLKRKEAAESTAIANKELNEKVARLNFIAKLEAESKNGEGDTNPFTPAITAEQEKLKLDVLKTTAKVEKAATEEVKLALQAKNEEEQKGIKIIQERAATAKAASDSQIAGLELQIAKQQQINALVDAQRGLTAQQQALSKANTDGILQGYDQQLQSLERAKELAAELGSQETTDAQLRLALQNELARLGVNANTSEKDFLTTKQKIEDQLASAKRNALLTEQKIQTDNLKLDLARNAAARTAADLQANINLLKATSETLSAKATVETTKDPAQKAIAESVLDIRKQQEGLAKDAIANQKEINKLGEQSDKVSQQVLATTQANAKAQFEYTDAVRKSTQAIDLGRQAQELKNKAIKEGSAEQKAQNEEIKKGNDAAVQGQIDLAAAKKAAREAEKPLFVSKGTTDPKEAIRIAIDLQKKFASLNDTNPFGGRGFDFGSLTGKAEKDLRNKLEDQFGLQRGASTLASSFKQVGNLSAFRDRDAAPNTPRSFTDGRTTNNASSSVSNQNTINIIDSSDPFGDATRALIAVGRA